MVSSTQSKHPTKLAWIGTSFFPVHSYYIKRFKANTVHSLDTSSIEVFVAADMIVNKFTTSGRFSSKLGKNNHVYSPIEWYLMVGRLSDFAFLMTRWIVSGESIDSWRKKRVSDTCNQYSWIFIRWRLAHFFFSICQAHNSFLILYLFMIFPINIRSGSIYSGNGMFVLYLVLNWMSRSLQSSTCWIWSSPTGISISYSSSKIMYV